MGNFRLLASNNGKGPRRGKVALPVCGLEVDTPCFMPVATQGAMKAMDFEGLEGQGYGLILANLYHLSLAPGLDAVEALGGLRKFTGWNRGWLTDSGGYQVFSLSSHRKLDKDGVSFRSPREGNLLRLTAAGAAQAQSALGVDIAMCLDVCPPAGASEEEVSQAVDLTQDWARQQREAWQGPGWLFGIVQGGRFQDQRRKSLEALVGLAFDGYAVGGVSVGEGEEEILKAVSHTVPRLPKDLPRYLMGVGEPSQILHGVEQGVDMFDCVLPARHGRHGQALTRKGPLRLLAQAYRKDESALDSGCACPVCRRHSRAYIAHLQREKHPTAALLLTRHNMAFMWDLMASVRLCLDRGEGLSSVRQEFGIASQ